MLFMDFTPTGWFARYDSNDDPIRARAIEAWHPASSRALVVDRSHDGLVFADDLPGYQGIEQCGRIIAGFAAMPGWMLRHWAEEPDPDNRSAEDLPIVGWLVDDHGDLIPVPVATDDSFASPSFRQRTVIIPPISTPPQDF